MPYVPAEQRRDELVAAALRVFARDGVVGTTTRRVAEEAGVPVASLHYCFGDKDELYAAVLERLTADLLRLVAELDPRAGDLEGVLLRAVEVAWPVVGGDRGARTAAVELTLVATRTPGLAGLAREQYAVTLAALATFLGAAARAHGLDVPAADLARLSRWTAATVDGAVLGVLVDGDDAAGRAVLEDFAGVLAARLRAAGAPKDQATDPHAVEPAVPSAGQPRVPRPARRAGG